MQLLAKPVLANKFWIVEQNGQKIGTIRKSDTGVVYNVGTTNQMFKKMEELQKTLSVSFTDKDVAPVAKEVFEVNDYTCKSKPFNGIFDLKRKLPLYTKTANSQSFFCAGYYCIKFENGWVPAYCPKLITLSRNEYKGPLKTKLEMTEILRKLNND